MGNTMKAKPQPQQGDMIEFHREGYKHWAIYVGDGYVVHLTAAGFDFNWVLSIFDGRFQLAEIKKEKLSKVAVKDKWEINNYLDYKYRPYEAYDIVKQALALVGEKYKYDLLNKNCEHFATLLRYGIAHSQQVEDAAEQVPLIDIARELSRIFN